MYNREYISELNPAAPDWVQDQIAGDLDWRDNEIERLNGQIHTLLERSDALRNDKKEMREEIERLKKLWYADADPEETEYAEDYYAQIDERSGVILPASNEDTDRDAEQYIKFGLREEDLP